MPADGTGSSALPPNEAVEDTANAATKNDIRIGPILRLHAITAPYVQRIVAGTVQPKLKRAAGRSPDPAPVSTEKKTGQPRTRPGGSAGVGMICSKVSSTAWMARPTPWSRHTTATARCVRGSASSR